ncbi:MAG: UDP-glucose/GDP-mannose dehydrogenase family protein [Myxococcota bacterium]|nr:UDP-glucose/GDP-mannose dehydrogenase family protein [Myxococcota bacterium]
MRVSVIGAGYVGLVTSACLAEKGHDLVCVDLDAARVDQVNRAELPIFEPGLEALLERHAGVRIRATTDTAEAVAATELTLIAVDTPFDGARIDLRSVEAAARQVGEALAAKADYHVVVVKSTVVPGTTDRVVRSAVEGASGRVAGTGFGLGTNPEFLTEGEAVSDFMEPDRIVVGGIDARSCDAIERLYASFDGVPVVRTDPGTAEMIKYASNALLATLISFSNELANLGAAVGGIDTVDVSRGLHLSRYLTLQEGPGRGRTAPIASFLEAGCGFGGSCLPKDVAALIAHGAAWGRPMPLLEAVLEVNRHQPPELIRLLERELADLAGKRISVLGLSFRPDTNDTRESPAIPIVQALQESGARVRAYDPVVREEARGVFGPALEICDRLEEAVCDSDALVVVTRWDEFQRLPELLRTLSPQPLVVDGRRMLDRSQIARYAGIGL